MSSYFIGWDVGGWNCDKNAKSRDAIAVLNSSGQPVGKPFRGNLRQDINVSSSAKEFISALFNHCEIPVPDPIPNCTLAIDAPLGFSWWFRNLIQGRPYPDSIEEHATNSYLFRETELFLIQKGINPLSPIKDIIGSQTTKVLHALSRYGFERIETGVWRSGSITTIEAYPSACRKSERMNTRQERISSYIPENAGEARRKDIVDALYCAFTARDFSDARKTLVPPKSDIDDKEGWIWVPMDCLDHQEEK